MLKIFRLLISLLLFTNILFAEDLESLLKQYESKSQNSLSTVDEKFGHVVIYSQKELRLMQYTKLSDLLKETPLNNLSKNKFGYSTLTLPGTKTDVSGFFRFFINDHEVSSIYTQSPPLSWIDMPLDFVDYIEIYRGNSSFSLGNETGIFFIRVYTKKPYKENGTQLNATLSSFGTNSQSISHSQSFDNGWSYLGSLNRSKTNETVNFNNNTLYNDMQRRYLFLDIENENTKINFAYTDLKKDNYLGFSMDANPDDGEVQRKDYFFDITKYFLEDESLKFNLSFDENNLKYSEKNAQGIALVPVLDLANLGTTIPKEYYSDLRLRKINTLLSKNIESGNNNLLLGLNFKHKKYDVKSNTSINFLNTKTEHGDISSFNKESIYSFLLQDDYRVSNNLLFILNSKFDKYVRNGNLDNFTVSDYRIGAIYKPFDNFGIKTFYATSTLPVTFFNNDFADKRTPNLESQKYKYYTIEGVYTSEKSKFSLIYNNVKIKDFIYYTPVGFINIDHTVKTQGLVFDYIYELNTNNKLELNYYTTWLSETLNNSSKGGYIKLMGDYDKFSYFTSLVYRNGYSYYDVSTSDSYNLNLGVTYKYSKNLSFSLKGENLLDDSTSSLYEVGLSSTRFAIEDNQRTFTLNVKWMF